MAHFAKISDENIVLNVVVVNDSDMLNADGVEDETVGQQYLETHNNWPAAMWIQTSYNTIENTHKSGDNSKAFRGNYSGVGYTWDEDNEIFWPEKPYTSWVKNVSEARWQSPIGDPPSFTEEQLTQNKTIYDSDGNITTAGTHQWQYDWDEDNRTWNLKNAIA